MSNPTTSGWRRRFGDRVSETAFGTSDRDTHTRVTVDELGARHRTPPVEQDGAFDIGEPAGLQVGVRLVPVSNGRGQVTLNGQSYNVMLHEDGLSPDGSPRSGRYLQAPTDQASDLVAEAVAILDRNVSERSQDSRYRPPQTGQYEAIRRSPRYQQFAPQQEAGSQPEAQGASPSESRSEIWTRSAGTAAAETWVRGEASTDQVRGLQRSLQQAGVDLADDGDWGPLTDAALSKVAAANGIERNQYDPVTPELRRAIFRTQGERRTRQNSR